METESWLVLSTCALLVFYLLWKLHSADKRIEDIRNSSYVALKQDSHIFRQLDEAQKELAEKDLHIAHLASNVSALNNARAMNKRLDEENNSLKSALSAEREQYQSEVNAFEKQLLRSQIEITHWRNEAQESSKCSAQFTKMKGEIAELKRRCEAAELKAKEAAQKPNLRNELEAFTQQCKNAEQRNKELTAQNSKLKKEIEALKVRCGNAEKKNEEITVQHSNLWSENEELNKQCRNAAYQIEQLTAELSDVHEYKRKAEQWKRDLETVTKRIAAMRKDESENKQLKGQLQSLTERNASLEEFAASAKKQFSASAKRIQELEKKLKVEMQQKRPPLLSNEMECVICFAQRKCMLLRPCMHACVCGQCSQRIDRCPLCTAELTVKERVFL